jgi:hypothetical protein
MIISHGNAKQCGFGTGVALGNSRGKGYRAVIFSRKEMRYLYSPEARDNKYPV